jgi:hypothetical protein
VRGSTDALHNACSRSSTANVDSSLAMMDTPRHSQKRSRAVRLPRRLGFHGTGGGVSPCGPRVVTVVDAASCQAPIAPDLARCRVREQSKRDRCNCNDRVFAHRGPHFARPDASADAPDLPFGVPQKATRDAGSTRRPTPLDAAV